MVPVSVDFEWFPGLSPSQKQKSIRSLHAAAAGRNLPRVLEISTKSESPLGVALSAFNLQMTTTGGRTTTVEALFQGSKVFQNGGPFVDLLEGKPAAARADSRLRDSGKLIGFNLEGVDWGLQPTTAFYDWLYLTAVRQTPRLGEFLVGHDGFTDIEFNPARSMNCQAASAALFVALSRRDELGAAMETQEAFIARLRSAATT